MTPLRDIASRATITRDVFLYHYEELVADLADRSSRGEALSPTAIRALWREALEPPAEVRASQVLMLQWTLLYLRSWNPLFFWASLAGSSFVCATLVYKFVLALIG
jgi:hypothetical protein